MSSNGQDILIVGAGVIGLSLGWRLLGAGASVTIVERGKEGAASRAAAGMLAPTAEAHFEETELLAMGRTSLAMYPEFVAELEEYTGLDVDYRREGTLVVGLDRDDAAALDHIHRYHRELGLGAERLSAAQAHELEPGLSPNIHTALFCPDDHQVDPRRLVDALTRAFKKAGGRLLFGLAVEEIQRDGQRLQGVRTSTGATLNADQVVICAGAWSRTIEGLPPEDHFPLRPVRGQMLAIVLGEPVLCRHVIRAPDAYLVPKSDGRLIIGATSEEVGFDDRLTAGGVFELLRGAWETMPAIAESPILEMWTGFRPVTLDNLPVMGPSAGLDRLWYAAGHGRNGILLTPWTAATMVEALQGETDIPYLDALSASRFSR
ncbi:MAG: glycine oxidase ThiO [Bradymonadaceae bacterium]